VPFDKRIVKTATGEYHPLDPLLILGPKLDLVKVALIYSQSTARSAAFLYPSSPLGLMLPGNLVVILRACGGSGRG
jgi:hypothetical protein